MTTDRATYLVHGVNSSAELTAANDLLARTQLPSYADCIRWLRRSGPRWPGFNIEHTRVAYAGNEPVGGLRILTLTLRIGRARLKCGGIGWVSTDPAHRNRGVCRALMSDAHAYMARHGYHVSLLFGVPGLYQKFGYVTAVPTPTVVVSADTQPIAPARYRTRRVTRKDLTRLFAVHTANMKDAPFAIERNAAYFETLFDCTSPTIPFPPDWRASAAVLDARGRFIGYVMPQHGDGELHIKELGVSEVGHCDAVLDAALALARRNGFARVRFHVPPWHVFARRLREYESLHETQFYRDREGMIRFIDRDAALARMAPEWRHRLRAAGIESDTWSSAGRARIVDSIESNALCRLVVGFTSGEEWARDHGAHLSRAQRRVVEVLFPERQPFVWPIDHF